MTYDSAASLITEMLKVAMLIGAPILLTSATVGLIVSIFQVITQIQDVSLSFIPKIVAVVAVIIITGGWMLLRLGAYAEQTISSISYIK